MVGVSALIIKTMNDAGEFKKLTPHFAGECFPVSGAIGAEDITILKNGIAIISCDDRRKTLNGTPVQGTIYAYDLKEEMPQLIDLTAGVKFEFHPHGISVFENKNSEVRLAAVNHTQTKNSIEIFDLKNNVLIHDKTILDPLLVSPNDLVMIDNNMLYVTNDHSVSTQKGKMIEDFLQLSRSNVLFYNGQNFAVAATKLGYANGINVSRDGTTLYIAETVGNRLSIFSRNTSTNELLFKQSIDFKSGIDNIEIDAAGNLWIGSHPKLLTFARHAKNGEKLSPSQVFKVSPVADNTYAVDEIYLDSGDGLSASSVAAVYNNTMLIGPVFDEYFLQCDFNNGF